MIDPLEVRPHFPALDPVRRGGTPPVFFDNPAGTQVAAESLARMEDYLVHRNANHSGAFRSSRESDEMVRQTRAALADFLGADFHVLVLGWPASGVTLRRRPAQLSGSNVALRFSIW